MKIIQTIDGTFIKDKKQENKTSKRNI